mmetsp:Transcript_11003/g.36166  ORF Transcript_11003/g.36166 Transcript_11003/m.36166 type:complete len:212 (+) Transcript_11003:2794-3429(+)
MKRGTLITAPVSSVAGLEPPCCVFPLTPGMVSATSSDTTGSLSTDSTFSSQNTTIASIPSFRKSAQSSFCKRDSSYVSMSINTYSSPSMYVNCIFRFTTDASSIFSVERKVFSTELPVSRFLSFDRTNAAPLPGLTCINSSTLYGTLSSSTVNPFLRSLTLMGFPARTTSRAPRAPPGLARTPPILRCCSTLPSIVEPCVAAICDRSGCGS